MRKMLFILSAFSLSSTGFCATTNFSNGKTAGDLLYVSAQFPIDPVTGQMMEGDIGQLTDITLDHIQHILHKKGYKMQDVVKTEVYLIDIRDFEMMDATYGERFPYQFPPARDIIVAPQLLNNSRIQISCIAYKQ